MHGLRVVVAAPIVERERVDEFVHALLEERDVRIAHGDVRAPPIRDELGAIRDLLHERMHERVRRLGDRDARDKALVLERPEGRRVLGLRRDALEHPRPERSPDHCGVLRDPAWRFIEIVQMRLEEVLDGAGHGDLLARLQRSHDLFDEERVAAGALEDERLRRRIEGRGREPVDELRGSVVRERLETEDLRLPGDIGPLAGRRHEEAPQVTHRAHELRDDLSRGHVAPVKILHDDDERRGRGAARERPAEERQEQTALAGRIER